MRGRRRLGMVAVATLLLTACGSTSEETRSLDTPPPAPTTDATTHGAAAPTAPSVSSLDADPSSSPASESEPAATTPMTAADPSEASSPSSTVAPAPEPEPEPALTWPDDECSLDNSPGTAVAADGPAPALEVRPESAAGPLPDLAVRRVNCGGGWVDLRNEIPAAQPLLVWFWAPH